MSKGGDPSKPHGAVQAEDGFWYCSCGWRRERTFTKAAVSHHIAMMKLREKRDDVQRRLRK